MRDVMAPGGIIYRVSPDGKDFEIYSSGYRNIFDAAINHEGELFTYDADMEYDFNTSWYRPTRICHAVSGSEFGWRNGAGKWPEWYPDSLPATLNVGPGSPTGMTFGYGAKFPASYQEAMFSCDWSWGRLYAIRLKPEGSTYTATKEEFLNGAPLPLTDVIINPQDGAMYFTIGGRRVQSGLYRVTYTGAESTAPAAPKTDPAAAQARATRLKLEAFHGKTDPQAVDTAWPYLDNPDRFIRSAARVAIEWQPATEWTEKALGEKKPARQVQALLALARATGIDKFHRKPGDPPADKEMEARILAALQAIDWNRLDEEQRVTLVRDYEISLNRFGRPDDATVAGILAQLDPRFPAEKFELNWMLCETLVYLQSPMVAAKAIALLEKAPAQEEQIEYARSLRMLKAGWTTPLHTAYFNWFLKAANYRGGASFGRFIEFIRKDAVGSLSPEEKTELREVLAKEAVKMTPLQATASVLAGRKTVREWKLDDLAADADAGMKARDYDTGRRMFGAAGCVVCHRFGNEGGMTAPDLTTAGARYSPRDLLDQIINPSKEINEQFVPMIITRNDGETVTGVIVNLNGDTVSVNTDPADPNQQTSVDRKSVKSIEPSKISPMPEGLLNMLTKDEILDLVAYVLCGGDPKSKAFGKR
jgi:putative heme-binding domain-containing protein